MAVQYKNDKHRRVVELWLGGMSQRAIADHEGVSQVEGIVGIIKRYCNRERVYSKDGRSFSYRLTRDVHPEAPMSDSRQQDHWPTPYYGRHEDDGEGLESAVLAAADALNDAVYKAECGWAGGQTAKRKIFMAVRDGRLHVVVAHCPEAGW